MDDLTAIQYLCMTCIAEGQGAPVDINLLDLVDMSKAFAQTAKTTAKPEKFSLNRGLNVHGERSHAAVSSELSQVHNRGVFKLKDPKKLTYEQVKNSL